MKNKWDYLSRLKSAIEDRHKCSALYLRTELVDETMRGQTTWVGNVEVFALTGHRKAKRCYAWHRRGGKSGKDERFVTVLGIPPIDSVQAAVRASIALDSKARLT